MSDVLAVPILRTSCYAEHVIICDAPTHGEWFKLLSYRSAHANFLCNTKVHRRTVMLLQLEI